MICYFCRRQEAGLGRIASVSVLTPVPSSAKVKMVFQFSITLFNVFAGIGSPVLWCRRCEKRIEEALSETIRKSTEG